jgi:signal transduction histidine kinase
MPTRKIFEKSEKEIIEKVKIAFAIFSIQGGKMRPVLVTDGLCTLFKKDRDSLLYYFSNTIGLQIFPEDRPIINESFKKVVEDPELNLSIEYRFHTGDEIYFWIQNDVTPEKLDDGSYIYYVYYKDNSTAHNMLPTKELLDLFPIPIKSNESLYTEDKESNLQILHKAMVQARFLYWIFDIKSNLITANNCFIGLFENDTLIKEYPQCLFDMKIIHIDEKTKYYSALNKAIKEGVIAEDNFKTLDVETKDYHLMHYRFTPIKNKDNTVKAVIGTAERYSSINKMFSIIRSLLNQNELITWNYFIDSSKLNIGKSEIKTKELDLDRAIVHKALFDGTIKIPQEIIEGKKNQTYKIIMLKDDIGSVYKFEITHTLLKEKGKANAILGMARDVTKFYAMEDKYIKELEKANTNKTAFLGRLTHDMRTPLGAIASLSTFGLDEVTDEKALLYFSKIRDNSEYLLSFITDVLESRKIGEGKLSFQPELFIPKIVFEQVMSIIQVRAIDKDIKLDIVNENAFFEQTLFSDVSKIKKLFINLINNAIKYTPKGGTVKLKTRGSKNIDGSLRVECSVSDNGVGMSKEFQKHMFDEFSQEHNKLSFEEEGTGLGLSIVKRIVEVLDGTITCESELNKGSTFTFVFNCQIATKKQLKEFNSSVNRNNNKTLDKKRVLVCEDKKINVMIESKLLKDKGIIIDVAQNGLIGVKKAKNNTYDAILMDVRMPGMDGLTATREIRKFNKTVPIIALSANATQEDKIKSLEAGMNDHISKPIYKEELYKTLLEYID